MRWWMVKTLWQKEMLETLRDKRTLVIMVLLPIALYPVIGILSSQAQMTQLRKLAESKSVIGILGTGLPSGLKARLLKKDDIRVLSGKEAWKEDLREGKLAAVLSLPSIFEEDIRQGRQGKVALFFASTKDVSKTVAKRIREALEGYREEVLQGRLKASSLPADFARPLALEETDVISKTGRGRHILSKIFPLIMILMTVMGALYPAIDLTAGEKERGTLETLLTAPVTAMEIVTGKYLAVLCIAVFTGLLNLLSLAFTFSQSLRMAGVQGVQGAGAEGAQAGMLTWVHYVGIFGFLVLIAALASSAMMLTVWARSFKEAQNFVTPVYLLMVLPTIITSFPGVEATPSTALLPVINVAFGIQGLINGTLTAPYLLGIVLSMSSLILVALLASARLFAHESVLFRDADTSFSWNLWERSKQKVLDAAPLSEAIILLSLQTILLFYVGISLQKSNLAMGLAVTLYLLIAAPPLVFSWVRKIDIPQAFSLRKLPPLVYLAVVLISLGLLPLLSTATDLISSVLFPGYREFAQEMGKSLSLDKFGLSRPAFLFLLAVSPGICEELLFRGFLFSAFRVYLKPWPTILITAFLFAAFHLSIYRLLPTFSLGIVFGWIVWRTGSIYPAMLAHAVNNGVVLLLSMAAPQFLSPHRFGPPEVAILCLVGGLLLTAGLFLLRRTLSAKPDGLKAAS